RDYELHSLDFSTAFLQGSLHEEIWLRRPPGFTGSFPSGTQWSLRRPVYGLRQAPREWHDTLRTTLAALSFAPSTADPSLFLRTDTTLPPFYVLVYVDDLVFASADTEALAHMNLHKEIWLRRLPGFTGSFPPGTQWSLRRLVYGLRQAPRERHETLRTTLAALGFAPSTAEPSLFLRTDTSLPPFYILVYVDDLVFATVDTEALALVKSVLQKRHTCTDLGPSALRLHLVLAIAHSSGYRPLALSSTFGRLRRAEWPGYTFSLGSGSVSWRSTRSSSVLRSNCEAEIYATAMATQELRWLTYLLTDLGERPRSPPLLYVDNKAAIALCQEHRLEHRTKHIALRYFLARELQQRGQLCLAHVATRANTADIFTKALPSGDHQHFCTLLGLVPTLPQLL
ncbi:unnamed protein product, partial [Closterium sp. NIES-53]